MFGSFIRSVRTASSNCSPTSGINKSPFSSATPEVQIPASANPFRIASATALCVSTSCPYPSICAWPIPLDFRIESNIIRAEVPFRLLMNRILTRSSIVYPSRDAIPRDVVAIWINLRSDRGSNCIISLQSGRNEKSGRLNGAAWQELCLRERTAPILPALRTCMKMPRFLTRCASSSSAGSYAPDRRSVRSILPGSVVNTASISVFESQPSVNAGIWTNPLALTVAIWIPEPRECGIA